MRAACGKCKKELAKCEIEDGVWVSQEEQMVNSMEKGFEG